MCLLLSPAAYMLFRLVSVVETISGARDVAAGGVKARFRRGGVREVGLFCTLGSLFFVTYLCSAQKAMRDKM